MSHLRKISKSEKQQILDLHNLVRESLTKKTKNKVINEQAAPLTGEALLNSAIEKCRIAKGGVIRRATGKPSIIYKVADYDSPAGNFQVGDELFILSDMTFSVKRNNQYIKNNAGQIKKISWQCSALKPFSPTNAEIEQLKGQGWKTKEELAAMGKDITNMRDYQEKRIGDVILYKGTPVATGNVQSGSAGGQAWIQWMIDNDFIPQPTDTEKTKLVPILVSKTGYSGTDFPKDAKVWFDPLQKPALAKANQLGQNLEATDPGRENCRKIVDSFYDTFMVSRSEREEDLPNRADIIKQKMAVQRCVFDFYNRWGVFGGGKKLDQKIDILTGSVGGGPKRNSIFRLTPGGRKL